MMMDRWKLTGIWLLIAMVLLVMLTGCKTKYVSVPEYHTQYVVRTDSVEKWDSIYLHDSTYIYKVGDTVSVYVYRDKYKYKYLDRIHIDTLMKTDSIRVPYPVEKRLTKWERVKMETGGISLVIICVIIIYFMIRFIRLLARSKQKS